jgi:hypothetical protein
VMAKSGAVHGRVGRGRADLYPSPSRPDVNIV